MDTWRPVSKPKQFDSSRDIDKLEINIRTNDTLPFLIVGDDSSQDVVEEPVEVIIFRVVFALLISISLVINILLILAILRLKCRIAVVYIILSYLIVPDILFYIKLITELIHWDTEHPTWSANQWSCGLWQFASHLYPILYSYILISIVYHAFISLYMDYKGEYERSCRKYLPLLLTGLTLFLSVVCASSGFYAGARSASLPHHGDARQYCDLTVPSIIGDPTPETAQVAMVTYRLVYEIVLPYLVPLLMVGFPYVSLLVGIIRTPESTEHSSYNTKMSVVVSLWVLTTYVMFNVPSIIR